MNRCLCCNESRDYEEPVCGNCGADWKTVEALDLDTQLTRYKAQVEKMLAQDPNGTFDVQFRNLRKAFKISYDAHQEIQKKFLTSIKAIAHLKTFQIEFNHNVQDAFAGQHTLLEFRFTNLSTTNYFGKVRLHWDDDETSDDMDYVAECDDLIAPEQVILLQETHVFQTPGAKVVKKLEIIVEGTSGEVAKFVASNFQLKIEDPTKTVFNSFTNNTNITARLMSEVDVGANAAAPVVTADKSPRWEKLSFIWVADETTTNAAASPATNKTTPAAPPESPSTNDQQEAGAIDCPSCGTSNPPGSVFCSDCGTPLTSRTATVASSPPGQPSVEERSNATPLPSTPEVEVGDLRGAVEQCFEHLRKFSALASSSASKGVFSAVDFSFDLLEQIHDVTPDNELDAIVGMVCEKPTGVEVDDEDFITNFVGKASVVSLMGITVVDNDDPEQLHFQQHLWEELSTASYGIFRQRFGPNSYIISIGNPSTNESFPGLRFDMRRYKGEESIENMYEKTSASLAQIFSFCLSKPADDSNIVESPLDLAAQASSSEVLLEAETSLHSDLAEDSPTWVKCIHPECGNFNPSDTKFCSECGTNQQATTSDVIHCHACSTPVSAGVLYCPECGTAQTPIAGAAMVAPTEILVEAPAAIEEAPVQVPPEPEVSEVETIAEELPQLVVPEPPPEPAIDPRQLLINQRFAERERLLTGYLKHLATATQLCIEGAPKSIFIDTEVSPELKSILSATVEAWANEPIAICLEPHQTECTEDGELLGWSGPASVVSAHGIFHMEQNQHGSYQFEGSNYFLSWEKFFFEFNAGLVLREVGPDLWMGTNDKYLIRGTYADYSINVLQWDYFEDFVKQTLLTTLDSFKHSVQHTYD